MTHSGVGERGWWLDYLHQRQSCDTQRGGWEGLVVRLLTSLRRSRDTQRGGWEGLVVRLLTSLRWSCDTQRGGWEGLMVRLLTSLRRSRDTQRGGWEGLVVRLLTSLRRSRDTQRGGWEGLVVRLLTSLRRSRDTQRGGWEGPLVCGLSSPSASSVVWDSSLTAGVIWFTFCCKKQTYNKNQFICYQHQTIITLKYISYSKTKEMTSLTHFYLWHQDIWLRTSDIKRGNHPTEIIYHTEHWLEQEMNNEWMLNQWDTALSTSLQV